MTDVFERLLPFLTEQDHRHVRILAKYLRGGRLTLFAGAGLSFNAPRADGADGRMPGWSALTERLREFLPGVGGHEPATKVADLFESTFGRRALIESLMSAIPDHEFLPGDVHRLLPELGFRDIITSNFDTLIERAYRERHIEPEVVVSDRFAAPGLMARLYKINGCFDRSPFDVVITSEDFRRWDQSRPLLRALVTSVFVESNVLFVGFSLEDPAFRAIHGRVRDILGPDQRMAYSLQFGVTDNIRDYWIRQGIVIIDLLRVPGRDSLDSESRLVLFLETLRDVASANEFSQRSSSESAIAEWRQPLVELRPDESGISRRTNGDGSTSRGATKSRISPAGEQPGVATQLPRIYATTEREFGSRDQPDRSCQDILVRSVRKVLNTLFIPSDRSPREDHEAITGARELIERVISIQESKTPSPALVPELPTLIASLYWSLCLLEPSDDNDLKFVSSVQWLDLRALLFASPDQQRAAFIFLMFAGPGIDLSLASKALCGGLQPAERGKFRQRLMSTCRPWRSIALGASTTASSEAPVATRAEILDGPAALLQQTGADILYRLREFLEGIPLPSDLRERALDGLRGQILPELGIPATREEFFRVLRYLNIDDDCNPDTSWGVNRAREIRANSSTDPCESRTPFHQRIRNILGGVREIETTTRASRMRRMVPAEIPGYSLVWLTIDLLNNRPLGRGSAWVNSSWRETAALVKETDPSTRAKAPYLPLLLLSMALDGGTLVDSRGPIIREAAERGVMGRTVRTTLSLLRVRLAEGGFSSLGLPFATMRRDSGLNRMVAGIAAFVALLLDLADEGTLDEPEDLELLAGLTRELLLRHWRWSAVSTLLPRRLSSFGRMKLLADPTRNLVADTALRWVEVSMDDPTFGMLDMEGQDWATLHTEAKGSDRLARVALRLIGLLGDDEVQRTAFGFSAVRLLLRWAEFGILHEARWGLDLWGWVRQYLASSRDAGGPGWLADAGQVTRTLARAPIADEVRAAHIGWLYSLVVAWFEDGLGDAHPSPSSSVPPERRSVWQVSWDRYLPALEAFTEGECAVLDGRLARTLIPSLRPPDELPDIRNDSHLDSELSFRCALRNAPKLYGADDDHWAAHGERIRELILGGAIGRGGVGYVADRLDMDDRLAFAQCVARRTAAGPVHLRAEAIQATATTVDRARTLRGVTLGEVEELLLDACRSEAREVRRAAAEWLEDLPPDVRESVRARHALRWAVTRAANEGALKVRPAAGDLKRLRRLLREAGGASTP